MFNNTVEHMKDNDYIEEKDGKLKNLSYFINIFFDEYGFIIIFLFSL